MRRFMGNQLLQEIRWRRRTRRSRFFMHQNPPNSQKPPKLLKSSKNPQPDSKLHLVTHFAYTMTLRYTSYRTGLDQNREAAPILGVVDYQDAFRYVLSSPTHLQSFVFSDSDHTSSAGIQSRCGRVTAATPYQP